MSAGEILKINSKFYKIVSDMVQFKKESDVFQFVNLPSASYFNLKLRVFIAISDK